MVLIVNDWPCVKFVRTVFVIVGVLHGRKIAGLTNKTQSKNTIVLTQSKLVIFFVIDKTD